ncbi:MAG: DUF4175 family protein [Candidatus Binatia bacterium]
MGQEDYRELSSFLDRFARRLKMLKGAEGLCLTGICLLLLLSLGLGIQEIKAIFPYAPMVYSLLSTALVVLLLGWTLFHWCQRVSQEWAALYIEKKCPHLRNNLINSLQLYPQIADEKRSHGISTSMVLALLRATRRQLHSLRVEELINTQRIRAECRLLGMLFIPVVAMVLFNPSSVSETFSLLIHPLKDLPPSHTSIDVTPKGIRVVRGSSVTIQATASGAIPKSMELILWSGENEEQEGPAQEKHLMEGLGTGKFSATIQELQKSLRYRVVTGPFSSPSYTIEAIDPPEIGNLKITLYPPHYTRLPTQTFQGGNVEGLKGSSLRLEASSTKEVAKAKILLDGGREVPLKIDGRRLQGNLVLFQSQRYQILVEDQLGFGNTPISYEIQVRPDGFPTVEFLRPTEDLEVNGDEILPLEFTGRDDFGIQEVTLSVRIDDRQERLPIQKDGNRKLIARERFNWDLGKLGLSEASEAIYHLEVFDNDTISGPKIGSSRSLRLRLKNLKGEHKQVAEMIRDLSGRMVDLLADHLERPLSGEKEALRQGEAADRGFDQKVDEMMKRIEEVMQRTEKDRLSDFATWSDLEALKRNLQFTKEELLKKQEQASSAEEKARLHDEIASELERMALLSEEISKRLKGQEVASTAQDLMRSQERLLDSLERLKSGDKNLDAVLKEISQLANLLGSLQQALSQFASRLPDEFTNSEALRGLSFGEMFSALEEIRKKLMQGDIEGAMQLARELFNQLASMVAALQNAQQSAMSSSLGRMQGEMMRSASELQQILREQQEILVDTEGVNKKGLGERDEVLKEKLDQFQAKAYEELSRLAELFPDEEREGRSGEGPRRDSLDETTVNHLVKNMIARLLKKDFSSFADIMEMAQKELGKKRTPEQEQKGKKAGDSLKELKANLEALLEEPLAALKDEDKKRLRDLSHRQGILKERTQDLHEKLDSLFQLFPSLDPQITRNIQEAGSSMGKAQNRLSDLDAKGAVPPEREALDRLSQSQQQMQNSMQQLAQRGQLGRMPVSRLFRMGRFLPSGMLVPLPGMPQFPQFDVEGGITGLDTERFRLPGKDEYKAPRSFREEILESLKQGVPPQLKEQVESYFKNLTE